MPVHLFFLTALKIDITAMGCNDPPAKGRCGASVGSIKVNGKEVSLNKRGINIVCIRYPKGKIIRRKNYDTYGSRANSVLLLKLIRRIPSNTIVLVSTRDSYNAGFTSSAQTALVSKCCLCVNTFKYNRFTLLF